MQILEYKAQWTSNLHKIIFRPFFLLNSQNKNLCAKNISESRKVFNDFFNVNFKNILFDVEHFLLDLSFRLSMSQFFSAALKFNFDDGYKIQLGNWGISNWCYVSSIPKEIC